MKKHLHDSLVPVTLDYTHSDATVIDGLKGPPGEIFKRTFLDEVKDGSSPFATALEENNIYDWSPHAPTMLIFSTGDEVVPSGQEISVFKRWVELNGNVDSINLGPHYNHAETFLHSLKEVRNWFDTF